MKRQIMVIFVPMGILFQDQRVHGQFQQLQTMVVMQGKALQDPSVQLEQRKIRVL